MREKAVRGGESDGFAKFCLKSASDEMRLFAHDFKQSGWVLLSYV